MDPLFWFTFDDTVVDDAGKHSTFKFGSWELLYMLVGNTLLKNISGWFLPDVWPFLIGEKKCLGCCLLSSCNLSSVLVLDELVLFSFVLWASRALLPKINKS